MLRAFGALICLVAVIAAGGRSQADDPDRRERRGPPFAIVSIRTELQRLLLPEDRDLVVLMNPAHFIDAQGNLALECWDVVEPALTARATDFRRQHGRAPVVDFHFPLQHNGVNLVDQGKALVPLTHRTIQRSGGIPCVSVWLNQRTERLLGADDADIADLENASPPDESGFGLGGVRVYPVRTLFSRLNASDADCVVRFERPLAEQQGRLDPADVERLITIVENAEFAARSKMLLFVQGDPPDRAAGRPLLAQLGITPEQQRRLTFSEIAVIFRR